MLHLLATSTALMMTMMTIVDFRIDALANNSPPKANPRYRPLHQRRTNSNDSSSSNNNNQLLLAVEQDLFRTNRYDAIIGSDESGTGCIAGPVVVVSCWIRALSSASFTDTAATAKASYRAVENVRDSKLLSAEECHAIYKHVQDHPELYCYSVTVKSNEQIDASESVQACLHDTIRESIHAVVEQITAAAAEPAAGTRVAAPTATGTAAAYNSSMRNDRILSIVDGHRSPTRMRVTSRPWKQADQIVYTVALASCIARSVHESLLLDAAGCYPRYGFDAHGGYPTPQHIQALHDHGPCPLHRTSCKPVRDRLSQSAPQRVGPSGPPLAVDRRTSLSTVLFLTTGLLPPLLGPQKSAIAMSTDPKTGVALPDPGEIESAVPAEWDSDMNPASEGIQSSFSRLDGTDDAIFYQAPRFVEHVDDAAVQRMTQYISQRAIQPDTRSVLDLCSSWTSHLESSGGSTLQRVVGLGMNAKELQANTALTDYVVQDLNQNPTLPYQDNSFDVVLCQLSIDYLTKPLQVCAEIRRVLRPGGTVHILFSNRLFLSKAVALWTGKDDVDHTFTVASYLHFGGGLEDIQAVDLSARNKKGRIVGDPLYVVTGTKSH
jgi:ribonuclease HII